jgi:hypothetical protein
MDPAIYTLIGAILAVSGGFLGNLFLQKAAARKEWEIQVRLATAELLAAAYSLEVYMHHNPTKADYMSGFGEIQKAQHMLSSLLSNKDALQIKFRNKAKQHWAILTQNVGFDGAVVQIASPPNLPPVEEIYQLLEEVVK